MHIDYVLYKIILNFLSLLLQWWEKTKCMVMMVMSVKFMAPGQVSDTSVGPKKLNSENITSLF